MSVNRETIEIQVSGLSQLNQLESTLLRALGAADALSDAVGRVGGSLESATGRFTQTAQIERALRRTRRVAQQSLVDPRARRAMGSAGVRRRQADVENMSAEISELRERRRQERLDIAERRRRVANLSRRSAQRRQEAQAADRRLQAQERRILEINDQMTGQVSEARLGSRTERSRTLIRRRQLDAQRLRTSGLYNTGELGRAAAALEGRYEALNREILDLERAETVLRDSAQGVIRNLQRRRAQASSPALQQGIQQELATVRSDLTRQLNAFQSQRQQLATNYGGLNEERRSINRTGRGRSVTFRAAESLNARADLLRNLYGASRDQTRVTIGGQRMQISEATRRAIEQANAGNTEAAKEILGFTSRRLTALEREINNTNKLADAEQRRLQIVQKLEDRFQQLRTANASGGNFQEFERLLGRVRELSGSRNMPLFNRIAAQASAAAGRVAIPKGFMRGAASPVLGTPFMEGSPRWIEAQRRAEARATSEAEAAGRRADKELRAAQSGYPSSPILGTATMMGSPRWKAQQERVRKSAEAALKSQERAANAAQKAADRDLREAQRGYPSSPVTGTASMMGSPKWKTEQERVRRSAERALRAQERAASIAQREADKVLRQAQSGYPSSPIRGTSAMSGSPRWVEAQERARLAAERRASAQARAEERVARKREAAIKKAERDADRALRESQKGYPSSPIMGTATMVDSPRWRANQDRLARAAARRAGTGGRITGPSSPIDAPQQLQSLVLRGERQQLNLLKLQQQGADVSSQLVNLENRLNSAKQAGYEISRANLKALESEVKASSDLASRETARIALARAATGGGGTARQTDTRSGLSQILANLQKASGEAIAFRGGRSGEQALSSIVEVFNASTAPPKASPLAPGPTAPRYTGPDAGREMEIDRYRGIFAGLTNNPRFYNRLLQGLPREAITTTMAGRASDISKAVEDAKRPDRKALESSIRLAYEEAVGNIPSAVTELFDKIGSVFDSIVNRVKGGTGGVSGAGGGAGGKPPLPPAAGGPEPQDFAGRVDAARGSADRLLGLKDLANLSAASANQLELLSQALSETRNGLKMTDKGFDQLTKALNKVDDQIARRDPNADFLTRRFGRRGGQAVGEGLIGGAFPLLFGQGAGAAAGGGLGGFFGGMAGGTLGFGLSLAGTAIGSQVDLLMQATQDTGNMLRDLVGNFEQIKESGLLASRSQENLIGNLLEAGNKTAAYAIIQDELNRKLGVDGAAKLREAADAGDRLKRAMADLGVQMQLFVAGPLTDFLNKIAGVLGEFNKTGTTATALGQIAGDKNREQFLKALARENVAAGANPNRSSVSFRAGPLGNVPVGPGNFGATGPDLLRDITSNLSVQRVREIAQQFAPARRNAPQTREQQSQRAIENAETRQAAAQRELEVFNKRNEGADILKGFKQQANAVRREQEDINRQSFELRRDYERQIEDIRRGVEDKISQLRQENAQKELEILVKQGQIREQQFKNAATALQGALAGDPLAQSLADAVTTYLGAQLSAQNEIEQRRKQFEIEINNQQVELERYKLDVARTISRLNTDTAEKVAQINLGIARRNEDAALNSFATEKQTAKLRFQLLAAELRVLEAKELNTAAQASAEAQRNPLMLPEYTAQFDAATSNATRLATAADNIVKNLIPQLEQIAPPPRLGEIAPVATRGVSLAGVNAQKARGDQLRAQFQAFSDELTGLVETGNFAEFTNRISEIGRGGFDELSSNLDTARKELALVGGDFGPIAQGITDAYQKVIDDLPRLTAKLTPELQAQVPALKKYLEVTKQSQIQLEKLRPTLEFYITGYGDLKSQTEQAKNGISELLSPTKNYDRLLEQINKRGGLGINEEETRRLLQAARNLDELNARLKVLNGLNDIAGGWTDSFIQLNKELLKGGNLLESVQRFAEGVADRTLDVVLEFTLRPIQEQLFKNLSKVLGIEAPQDPTLLPIQETAKNTRDTALLLREQFAGQTGIKLPEPANNIVAGPSAAPAASAMTGRYMQGNIGPTSTGPHFHVMRQDGSYYPKNALDQYVEVNGRPLSSVPVSRGQEYGAPREYGPHTGRDYAFPKGASLGLMNGAKWIGNTAGTSVGDRTAFMTPDGKVYEIIHGRFKGEAKPIAPVAQPPAAVQTAAGPTPAPVPSGVTPDGRQYFPIPAGAPGSPNNPASLPVDKYVEPTTNASNKAANSIANLDQKASAAADGLQGLTQQTSETVTKFQTIVGTSLQAISSIAMGIGGAQMIRKGGAYNTLMGAASIFGSIGSITGMFGTGGGLSGLFGGGRSGIAPGPVAKAAGVKMRPGFFGPAFADGGRPNPYEPALIGEEGPELWVPDRPGTIIPNDELYVPGLDDKGGSAPSIGRYARRAASSMESGDGESGDTIYTGNYGRAVPYQRSETTREIDRLERITTNPKELPPIKYETTRVNEYDFVTPEQLEASNARTAKIARNQTIRELADSMKTRKRLGL